MHTKSQSYIEIEDLYSADKCIMWSCFIGRSFLVVLKVTSAMSSVWWSLLVDQNVSGRKVRCLVHTEICLILSQYTEIFVSLQMGKGPRSRSIGGSNLWIKHQTSPSWSSFSPHHSLTFTAASIQVQVTLLSLFFFILHLCPVITDKLYCFFFYYSVALVVCTRLKLIRSAVDRATTFEYLTNTSLTQIYCTGK